MKRVPILTDDVFGHGTEKKVIGWAEVSDDCPDSILAILGIVAGVLVSDVRKIYKIETAERSLVLSETRREQPRGRDK